MWSHQQPHLYENISLLEGDMILNKNFAIVSVLLAHFLVNEYNLNQEIHNIYTGTWHSNEFRLLRFTPSFRSLSSPRIALRDVEEAMEHPCHVNENYWFTYRMIVNWFFEMKRSTEEYPHLRPARLRRGFIHRGIMVKTEKKYNFKRKKELNIGKLAGSPATNLWTVHSHHLHWQISRRSCYVGWKH